MSRFAWAGPERMIGMALPMALWALHFVVVYSLAGLGCEEGWHRRPLLGSNLLTWSMILATALALVPIIALGVHARRRWRHNRAAEASEPRRARPRFLAMATMMLSILAAVAVVFTATPILMLPPCAG